MSYPFVRPVERFIIQKQGKDFCLLVGDGAAAYRIGLKARPLTRGMTSVLDAESVRVYVLDPADYGRLSSAETGKDLSLSERRVRIGRTSMKVIRTAEGLDPVVALLNPPDVNGGGLPFLVVDSESLLTVLEQAEMDMDATLGQGEMEQDEKSVVFNTSAAAAFALSIEVFSRFNKTPVKKVFSLPDESPGSIPCPEMPSLSCPAHRRKLSLDYLMQACNFFSPYPFRLYFPTDGLKGFRLWNPHKGALIMAQMMCPEEADPQGWAALGGITRPEKILTT